MIPLGTSLAWAASWAVSEYVAMQQWRTVVTKGQVEIPGLGCHPGTCGCLRGVQN